MYSDTLQVLTEWLEYISSDDFVDLNHFDQVHFIYNMINTNCPYSDVNAEYASTMAQLTTNAFIQYKICCENLDYDDQHTRIVVIFNNLLCNIRDLGFLDIDSDYSDYSSSSEEEYSSDEDQDQQDSESDSEYIMIKPRNQSDTQLSE